MEAQLAWPSSAAGEPPAWCSAQPLIGSHHDDEKALEMELCRDASSLAAGLVAEEPVCTPGGGVDGRVEGLDVSFAAGLVSWVVRTSHWAGSPRRSGLVCVWSGRLGRDVLGRSLGGVRLLSGGVFIMAFGVVDVLAIGDRGWTGFVWWVWRCKQWIFMMCYAVADTKERR